MAKSFGYMIVRQDTLERLLAQAKLAAEPSASESASGPSVDFVPTTLDLDDDPSDPTNGYGSPIPFLTDYENFSADDHFRQGEARLSEGNEELAFEHFARAIALVPRYEPAMQEMKRISDASLADAQALLADSPRRAVALLVRAIETNPANTNARDLLARILERRQEPDLTTMCFIFYDGNRARQIHGEAYKRALEFITIGGVVGDVLEFGVLGGWSARLLCEVMRDLGNFSRIHLFDSFDGLPEYDSAVDRTSYEIGGRKIWRDKMRFPESLLSRFKVPHEIHIRNRLGEIISKDRIAIHKGFYSETLKHDLGIKASLVHLDCDLYQSTAEVLWGLNRMNALQDGTVLIFDDWNCNRGNPNYGERRALQEYLDGQSKFKATHWFSYGYNGMVYILHDGEA